MYFWLLILLIVCAILCAVGFYKFVYFLSIGYGFAVAGGGIAIFIISLANGWLNSTPMLILAIAQMLLFVAYGARLSGFLLYRELKSAQYRKTLKEVTNDEKKMPIFVLVTIWIIVAVLYVLQISPMLFRYYNESKDIIVPCIGIGVSVLGLIIESISDKQKSKQKNENPNMVATKGLYKIVRCPNYFGEIVFWTGIFISGVTTYYGVAQWAFAIIAYICIVYIMFNGAQRLEKRQNQRYGGNEEYNLYVKKTPIIIPLLPIYHLNKKEK